MVVAFWLERDGVDQLVGEEVQELSVHDGNDPVDDTGREGKVVEGRSPESFGPVAGLDTQSVSWDLPPLHDCLLVVSVVAEEHHDGEDKRESSHTVGEDVCPGYELCWVGQESKCWEGDGDGGRRDVLGRSTEEAQNDEEHHVAHEQVSFV